MYGRHVQRDFVSSASRCAPALPKTRGINSFPLRFASRAPKETQRETRESLSRRGSPPKPLIGRGGGEGRMSCGNSYGGGDEARGVTPNGSNPVYPELHFPHVGCICPISSSKADAFDTRHSGEGAHGDTTPLAIALFLCLL